MISAILPILDFPAVPVRSQTRIRVPFITLLLLLILSGPLHGGNIRYLSQYNIRWDSPSKNSSESMPLGGGDIGCNVWVENGDLLLYISRSGTFDENNTMLKLGRIRIRFKPDPFSGEMTSFSQELKLKEGCIEIVGIKGDLKLKIRLWVEVFRPVIHAEARSNLPVVMEAAYESWRFEDHPLSRSERMQCLSFLDTEPSKIPLTTYCDNISNSHEEVFWYHRNRSNDLVFDKEVTQQHLDTIRALLRNPLKDLTFGGMMKGDRMVLGRLTQGVYQNTRFKGWTLISAEAAKKHSVEIILHTSQASGPETWLKELNQTVAANASPKTAWKANLKWWAAFWGRSHIVINDGAGPSDEGWRTGRNYQLFRYMLACNAYGDYPTKFNGGLFTFDPGLTSEKYIFATPDFRQWGGGSFTAQNQRLVYWPMLKSGDFSMMPPQFSLYSKNLETTELRNPWVSEEYDNALEFAFMILEYHRFSGADISSFLPFIKSSVKFFDDHYQYWGRNLTTRTLDNNGKLMIYPSTALETYKDARNPTPLISALRSVIPSLLELPASCISQKEKEYYQRLGNRIPEIPFREMKGKIVIAPAVSWKSINNIELPQLYPVFPYYLYGIGKEGYQIALDTWRYGADNPDQYGWVSWHQDAIFCARLGLWEEARDLVLKKLGDSPLRFPAFWGPGHDWVPDHNQGGSGMIALQEMLLQTRDSCIFLLPSWPPEWDADFRLHAPSQTTVEVKSKGRMIFRCRIDPPERKKDAVNMNNVSIKHKADFKIK